MFPLYRGLFCVGSDSLERRVDHRHRASGFIKRGVLLVLRLCETGSLFSGGSGTVGGGTLLFRLRAVVISTDAVKQGIDQPVVSGLMNPFANSQ